MILHLDFETFSRVDLRKRGAFNYAADKSTGIHFLGWAFDDEEPQLWRPGEPFPQRIVEHWARQEVRSTHAHNAQFERLITAHVLPRYVDAPQPLFDCWYCTAAQAALRGLPRGLDDLGKALGHRLRKDRRGAELIKLLCIPGEGGEFLHVRDPEAAAPLLEEFGEYCLQDIRTERAYASCSPPMSDEDHVDWVVNEVINARGLRVDVEFARAAQLYAGIEADEIGRDLARLTNGQITGARQFKRVKEWLGFQEDCSHENYELYRLCVRYKTDRKTKETTKRISMDKAARWNILSKEAEEPGTFPQHVLDLVELLDEAGRTSVHKYAARVNRAGEGDRVRGAYLFAGASATTRFSSTGLQVHNFVRDCLDEEEHARVRATVLSGGELADVLEVLAKSLRPTIVAKPGKVLVWGDFSAIEARVLPWLSKDADAERLLEMFRQGEDVYVDQGARIYGIPVDKVGDYERLVGKVAILSLGYEGGAGAFGSLARNYQLKISPDVAEQTKTRWRRLNPWAPRFWDGLIRGAIRAVRSPGRIFWVGRVSFMFDQSWGSLFCQLPDGHVLTYPQARMERVRNRWGDDEIALTSLKAEWKPAADEEGWPRVQLYGGLLANNVTQATAACLLRDVLFEMYDHDWPTIGHTHDEALLEVAKVDEDYAKDALAQIMRGAGASWADGLPIDAEVKSGERYRK